MASKLCDSCKSATSTLYCQADSAFLCLNCDSNIHAANKIVSRHARVFLCEVCEQAPAHVTCKADAASLCVTCDHDIHYANPLSQRHERVPVAPVYGSVVTGIKQPNAVGSFLDESCFSDVEGNTSREEVEEAASWLLPNAKVLDADPFLEFGYGSDLKIEAQELNSSGADCVVPVQIKAALVHDNYYESDFTGTKPCFGYGYSSHSFSQSVSSSSQDVGVVPDGGALTDKSTENQMAQRLSAVDREARVLRYREKRKNRKFEKTIRYASRKAYAEMRPRIKGRFVKRTDVDVDGGDRSSSCGFSVVPSF